MKFFNGVNFAYFFKQNLHTITVLESKVSIDRFKLLKRNLLIS